MTGDDVGVGSPSGRRARLPHLRIAESVAAELRFRILAGGARGIDALPPQEQLVAEFGVSPPSVREAIRILETEGLVTVRRGKVGGLEVHRPDEQSVAYHLGLVLQGAQVGRADLAAALGILEPQCAAECARRPDRAAAVVPALVANVEASARAVGSGPEFTRAAREFHDLVVGFTPNATVRTVVRSLVALWTAQEEAWATSRAAEGEYPSAAEADEVVRTHRRITEEVAAGRAPEVEELARAHLAATQARVLTRDPDEVVDARATRLRSAAPGLDGRRL